MEKDADAIVRYHRLATLARVIIYALLYVTPFLVVSDRTLNFVLSLLVPLVIVACAALIFWSSSRAEALQHGLNLRVERE